MTKAISHDSASILDNGKTGDARVALAIAPEADGGTLLPWLQTNGGNFFVSIEDTESMANAAADLGISVEALEAAIESGIADASVTRSQSLSDSDIAEWRDGNDSGDGYAIGDEGDTPEQAALRAGYEIVEVDDEGRVLAHADGCRVVICDASGPWAVAIGSDGSDDDEES